jgi:hypothetical protein
MNGGTGGEKEGQEEKRRKGGTRTGGEKEGQEEKKKDWR